MLFYLYIIFGCFILLVSINTCAKNDILEPITRNFNREKPFQPGKTLVRTHELRLENRYQYILKKKINKKNAMQSIIKRVNLKKSV